MKNSKEERPIIKEQLLKEDRFIEYCNFDAYRKRKLGTLINLDFLRAIENEGLLSPLLKQKETTTTHDGKEEKITVNYYSPFQIFMVAILSRNVVDSGHLRSPDTLEWQKQEGHHFISWGESSAFNTKLIKDKKELNYFSLYKFFHNFLRLLHSLEQTRDYDYIKQNRQRYFSSEYPHLNFDFRLVEKNIIKILSIYKLDIEKLNKIRAHVGLFANEIDPLGQWYYYLEKHPQTRKDQLKGAAILAQELYRLCDLIVDTVEMATGEKQKPLLDFLHPDIKPFGIENIEYATGTDFNAIEGSLKQMKVWIANKKNLKLVDETLNKLSQDEQSEVKNKIESLKKIEEDLKEFEQRYGKRHYQSGIRNVTYEEDINLNDLDAQSKRAVESLISQHKNIADKDGGKRLVTSYEEIEEQLKKKIITFEDAVRLDIETELKSNISLAIELRLGDIQRNLWSAIHSVPRSFFRARDSLREQWDDENEKLWGEFYANNPPQQETKASGKTRYTEPYQERIKKFTKKILPKALLHIDKRIELLKNKELEVGKIAKFSGLMLCLKCRENPVQLHYGQNDGQVVSDPICDNCLKEEDLQSTTISSLDCDFCGRSLVRFANKNRISDLIKNTARLSLALEYGRLKVIVKCPNSDCKQENQKYLDWGWLP